MRNVKACLIILIIGLTPFTIINTPKAHGLDIAYCLNDSGARLNNFYARGADYSVRIQNNKCFWQSESSWIWDNSSLSYSPYIFEDKYLSDGYYQVQTAQISARIYEFYTELYNPDMSEIRVYDERFEVDRWRSQGQGRWDIIGAQSGAVTFTVIVYSDGVNITRSFNSWAGWLNVTYVFDEKLKHDILWQNIMGSTETFRVRQLWAGIVGDRVKHNEGEDIISGEINVNSSVFVFKDSDNNVKAIENQASMYYDLSGQDSEVMPLRKVFQRLENTIIDTSAQGMKADFIFSNWTLADGEYLTIDPDSTTISPSLIDAMIWEFTPNTNYNDCLVILYCIRTYNLPNQIQRSFIEFNISSIPAAQAVTFARLDLYYYLWYDADPVGRDIELKRVTSNWVEGTVTWNSPPTFSASASTSEQYPAAYGWINFTVTTDVDFWHSGGDNHGWEMNDGNETGVDGYQGRLYSREIGGLGFPPVLYVEYEALVYVTGLFLTGISSMAYNSTNMQNNTATPIGNNSIASFDVNISSNYQFWRYELPESEDNHTHFQTYNRFITANYTITAYALQAGGGGVSGVSMLVLAVVGGFGLIVVAVASRKR